MLIEGPEPIDSLQQNAEPAVDSDNHEDSLTSQPSTGVLLLGMTLLHVLL